MNAFIYIRTATQCSKRMTNLRHTKSDICQQETATFQLSSCSIKRCTLARTPLVLRYILHVFLAGSLLVY